MIDILYLSWNRLEFTRQSFETMKQNTDWNAVHRLLVYDDGSTDGTAEYLQEALKQMPRRLQTRFRTTNHIGPIGIMRAFLMRAGEPIFAKIDNDVMLPPGWLGECRQLMQLHQQLDFLGIEARIDAPRAGPPPRKIVNAPYIGGIGLMRRRAFTSLPETGQTVRQGFTEWQCRHRYVRKAWINPPLPICLLNLVPVEPWASLSRQYVANGWQRDWPQCYTEHHKALWGWWANETVDSDSHDAKTENVSGAADAMLAAAIVG